MRTGLNSDVTGNDGKVYHVQTEDGGIANPVVRTRLFSKGVLLSSRNTSYAYLLDRDDVEVIVRQIMKDQHAAAIRDLSGGGDAKS